MYKNKRRAIHKLKIKSCPSLRKIHLERDLAIYSPVRLSVRPSVCHKLYHVKGSCCLPPGIIIVIACNEGGGTCFCQCLSVCLSVCLYVSKITQKRVHGSG